MRARQVISYGLIVGLELPTIRRSSPGFITDLFLYKQDYEMKMRGLRRKKAGE